MNFLGWGGCRDLQRVKFSTRKKIIFNPQTDQNPKKIFFSTRNLKNFYVTILALKIFKTAYNIRISIGYKDNFRQVFGINQISSGLGSSKFWYFSEKKLVFKPELDPNNYKLKPENRPELGKIWFSNPNPTRFRVWVGSGRVFFVSGIRCRALGGGRCNLFIPGKVSKYTVVDEIKGIFSHF